MLGVHQLLHLGLVLLGIQHVHLCGAGHQCPSSAGGGGGGGRGREGGKEGRPYLSVQINLMASGVVRVCTKTFCSNARTSIPLPVEGMVTEELVTVCVCVFHLGSTAMT